MEELTIKITHSDIVQFLTCRKKHYYSSHHFQNLEPIIESKALTFGTMFHEVMAMFYYGADDDDIEEYIYQTDPDEEVSKLALGMYYNYKQYAEVNDEIFSIKGIEQKFSTPIYVPKDVNIYKPFSTSGKHRILTLNTIPIEFVGIVDLVFEDNKGRLCILDHKTTKTLFSISNRKFLHAHTQLPTYAWAMISMGYKVDRIIYQELHKQVPDKLKLLKRITKGRRFSINTNQNVDLASALKTLIEAGEDIRHPEYVKFLLKLAKKTKFISRTSINTDRFDFDEIGKRILSITLELLNPLTIRYKNPSIQNCSMCRFNVPCYNPPDYEQIILDELYQQRTPYESLL